MVVEQRDPGDEDDVPTRPSPLARGWRFVGIEVDSGTAHWRGEGLVAIVGGEYQVFSEDDGYEVRWRPAAVKGGH